MNLRLRPAPLHKQTVLNILSGLLQGEPISPITAPQTLPLRVEPEANVGRYDSLREASVRPGWHLGRDGFPAPGAIGSYMRWKPKALWLSKRLLAQTGLSMSARNRVAKLHPSHEATRRLEIDDAADNLSHRQNQRPCVIATPLHGVVKRLQRIAIGEDAQCTAFNERVSP